MKNTGNSIIYIKSTYNIMGPSHFSPKLGRAATPGTKQSKKISYILNMQACKQ